MQHYTALFDSSSQTQPTVCSTILHYLTHQSTQTDISVTTLPYMQHYDTCCTIHNICVTLVNATQLYQLHYIQHLCNSSLCNTIIFVALYTTFVSTLSLQHILLHYTQHCGSLFLATQIHLLHSTPHDENSFLCNAIILVAPQVQIA